MIMMVFRMVILGCSLPPICTRDDSHTNQLAAPIKITKKNLTELSTKKLEKMLRRYERMVSMEDRGELVIRTECLCQLYKLVRPLLGIEQLSEKLTNKRADYLTQYRLLECDLKKVHRSIRRISAELVHRQTGA